MAYGIRQLKKDFPNDAVCAQFIFEALHSKECSCGGSYTQLKGRRQFQCSKCRFQIAPTATTIFHKSSTPLSLWFHAIWVFSCAKSGISALQMQRQLDVTYKCAWRILSQIRKALKQSNDPLRGIVEMDSAYIGGRRYGGINNEDLGRAVKAKSLIMGAIERGGRIRVKVVDRDTAETHKEFLHGNVTPENTVLISDKTSRLASAASAYHHYTVNHSKKEFVRGKVYTNTIETWFSHIKRSISGTFKTVSKQHLQSYLDAFAFHYNNRHNDKARFASLLGILLQTAK